VRVLGSVDYAWCSVWSVTLTYSIYGTGRLAMR
jgi:hypothetical protein